MKRYYGQMTKQQLLQTKIVAKDAGLPESERSPSDLKRQLAEAIAKRDKRYDKMQKSIAKFGESEKEVERLIAEMESDVESIGGISCSICEIPSDAPPVIPDGVDPYDPKTWQAGDIVKCLRSYSRYFSKSHEYTFLGLEMGVPKIELSKITSATTSASKFRFLRRP